MRVEKTEDYSRWIDGLKDHLVLLIVGGNKSTQAKDITRALELNRNYEG